MPAPRHPSLASRLTAGCVTLVVLGATVAAGFGWWWKFRASARERTLRTPAATAPAALPAAAPAPAPAPAAPGE
jgi:hypothetical protein